MYSRLLDQKTYAEVVRVAPDVTAPPASDARLILLALCQLSDELEPQTGMDRKPYFACLLADLPGLPEALPPKKVGLLCREMGLVMHRRAAGFQVAWSREQLALLLEFFGIYPIDD